MTLFAAVPCLIEPAGDGRVRHRDWSGVERTIDESDATALAHCAVFRPREGQVRELERAGVRDAAAVFDRLLAAGLLADAGKLLEPGAAPLTAKPPAEPLLVVRSYERPDGLKRLLESVRRAGIAHDVAIVDDTCDPVKGDATRAIATAFAQARGARTWLLGPAERDSAFAALETIDPATRALRDLLDPAVPSAITGSRTWNWAVLLSAGRALSILDDDTSFPLRRFPSDDARLELADSTEAVVRFFDDASWSEAAASDGDPYAELSCWLGRDCAELVATRGWREDALPFRSPVELAHLRGGSRVVGVVPGLYGGIAFNSSVYLLHSNPPSQASLFRDPYRHGRLEADAIWHGYPQPRLASHAVYTPLLLDNRELLPFAGTWGRVDDTYFLALLKVIAPDAAFAHVPWMLGHIDIAPRNRLAAATQPLLLDRNAGLASSFLDAGAVSTAVGREARLREIGRHCGEIARELDTGMRIRNDRFRAHMVGRVVAQLSAGLQRYPDAPAAWRETARAALTANAAELDRSMTTATEIDVLRRAYAQAARACDAWPALWNAAAANGGFLHEVAAALD